MNKNCGCKKAEAKGYKIQQLKYKGQCSEETVAVFPVSLLQSTKDICSGEYLDELLFRFNHIKVDYKGSLLNSIIDLDPRFKKSGLHITIEDPALGVKTYFYASPDLSDDSWTTLSNWVEVGSGSTQASGFKYGNLRVENRTIKIDEFDLNGVRTQTLSALIDLNGENITQLTEEIDTLKRKVAALELKEDKDTVYDESSLRTRVEALEGRVDNDTIFNPKPLEDRLTALEGRPEVQPYNDTELKGRVQALEEKEDKDTIFDPKPLIDRIKALEDRPQSTNPLTYDDSAVLRRLDALEQKEDKDTIYNDNAVVARIVALEAKQDQDTIYNDVELRSRIEVLEAKRDNDTIYDDSEVRRRLTALEAKEDRDTVFDPSTINNRLDALERKTDNDTVYNDTEVRNLISALTRQVSELQAQLAAKPNVDTNKYVVRGEWLENNTKLKLVYNDNSEIIIPMTIAPSPIPPAPQPTTKKIYFGHQERYNPATMPVDAVKEASMEADSLPIEVSFLNVIPTEGGGSHGYWGMAIPKSLAPTKPTLQTNSTGDWLKIEEGSMIISEEEIDGQSYWVFRDKTKNVNFNSASNPFTIKVIQ